jgi:hypothetical protein
MVEQMEVAPIAFFALIAVALLVLLLVGGLIALVVHRPTRTAGATIVGILISVILAALLFVGYARTSARPNMAMRVVADEHGQVIEQHLEPVDVRNEVYHGAYGTVARPDVANWARILVVALLIVMVGLLTSGERARSVAVKTLGVCALIIGGMAGLYFFRSVPGGPYVATRSLSNLQIGEAPPLSSPPAPIPPAPAPRVVPDAAPAEGQPVQTLPPVVSDSNGEAEKQTSEAPDQTTLPAEAPDDSGEKPADQTPPTPGTTSDSTANATAASNVAAAHEHDASPEAAAKSSAPQAALPDWVEELPRVAGNGDYLTHAKSGYFSSVEESQRALETDIVRVVQAYLSTYLRDENIAQRISISPALIDRIKRGPIHQEHRDVTVGSSVHPMIQLHQQLVIDDAARAEFKASWESLLRASRLWYLGCGALLVLALVGTLFSYLKLDLLTGGTYRGRLQLAATAAILVAAAAALIVS